MIIFFWKSIRTIKTVFIISMIVNSNTNVIKCIRFAFICLQIIWTCVDTGICAGFYAWISWGICRLLGRAGRLWKMNFCFSHSRHWYSRLFVSRHSSSLLSQNIWLLSKIIYWRFGWDTLRGSWGRNRFLTLAGFIFLGLITSSRSWRIYN